jgi:quinone-modifying oxidoreductase, subunit QmoB
MIKEDIAKEGANTLVIAACSPRVMYDVFSFDNCIVDRVNLREQVAWCQKPGEEDTQMMAEDYLRMALAKVGAMELPVPFKPEQEISRDILVVGGGLAGMTAAVEASKAGCQVVLVEKEAELGGFQKKVGQIATMPYKDLKENQVIPDLIKAVTSNPKIKVYTGATVEKSVGGPGVFEISIKQNGSTAEHRCGAIVMAAGWKPYDPNKLDKKLGFGASPDVITNTMFEEKYFGGNVTRPSDGKPAPRSPSCSAREAGIRSTCPTVPQSAAPRH